MKGQGFLGIADKFPPFICRYVARKRHGSQPKSHSDIAKQSGLSRSFVATLSKRRSWKGIPVNVIDSFSEACGVNLLAPKRTIEFLRYAQKNHLNGATASQRIFIASLFTRK